MRACGIGTDVNATDARGVTPLHLALSRLRVLGEGKGRGVGTGRDMGESSVRAEEPGGGEVPLFRKKEMMHVG